MRWKSGRFQSWESANGVYAIEPIEHGDRGAGKFRTYFAETKGETWHRIEFGKLHDCLCLAKAACEEHAKTNKPRAPQARELAHV